MKKVNKSVIVALAMIAVANATALDSATTVNAVATASTMAQAVANATNHTEVVGLINSITTVIISIISYIFGHRHGSKTVKK